MTFDAGFVSRAGASGHHILIPFVAQQAGLDIGLVLSSLRVPSSALPLACELLLGILQPSPSYVAGLVELRGK